MGEMIDKLLTFVPAGIGALAIVAVAVITWWNRRDADSAKKKTMTPPDWDTVWERIDLVERRQAASTRLLTQVLLQWPRDAAPPVMNPDDLKILEDTLPVGLWPVPKTEHTH